MVHFTDGPMRGNGPRISLTTINEFMRNDAGPVIVSDYVTSEESDKVVSRARALIGEGGYSFFSFNCEHFAYFCRTGVKHDPTDPYLDQIKMIRFEVLATELRVVNSIPGIGNLAAIAIGGAKVFLRLFARSLLHSAASFKFK